MIGRQVAVTTAATVLAGPVTGSFARALPVNVRNTSTAQSVWIGGQSVSATTAYEILPSAVEIVWMVDGETLYGVTTAGPHRVDVLRIG